MPRFQTETADYSASFLTRLYVFALSGIAVLLIGGQFLVQQSIFKNSGDARVINMAGRQRAFCQRIAKCAFGIDFAETEQAATHYTKELDASVKQCTLEHESLQFGADNVVVTQQYSPEMHLLFSRLEPSYQTLIKYARALIARQRAEPFNASREKTMSRYTAAILAQEPIVLDGLEDILTEIVKECGRRSDDLAQTEFSLLLATLLCLLLLALFIFRPAIEQIRSIILAMEKMQNRLDGTLSSMGEGLFQVDKNGDTSFVNETFEKMLGYSFEEVNGKNIHEILHVINASHPRECLFVNATRFNDEVQVIDDVFRHKDGTLIPVQIVSSPVIRRGERVGAVVTFRDVTERHVLDRRLNAQHSITLILQDATSVEEALPKILATLCECFEVNAGAVWLINSSKKALECVLVQHPPGEQFDDLDLICKKDSFRINEGIPGRVWKMKDALYLSDVFEKPELVIRTPQLKKAGLKSAFAFPIIQSQRVLGVIEFFGLELREPDEQLLTLVASTSNQIGEFVQRKRTEMHLVSSEARLNAIINSMAEGVIVSDLNGKFLLINQAAKKMHNAPVEENFIYDWTKLFTYYASDKRTILQTEDLPLTRAMRGESVDNVEIFLQPLSGESGIWLSATARQLCDEDGQLIGGVVVMNDITERKNSEKRLSDFYSTVSHELRTPLTSIKAALGLLEGGVAGHLSTKAMQLVSVGRSESDRLVRLINDILDVKKMEDGKFELHIVEVDLAKLVESCVAGLDAIVAESDLTVNVSIDEPAVVLGDRDRLTQVLYNLMSNAIKFSPKGSTITISVVHEHDYMRISIADKGRGIPEDQMHLLFGMFQQLNLGESRPPGTGLGLAICKKIVELHDGKIGLNSRVGEGSTFWFELPVRKASKVAS